MINSMTGFGRAQEQIGEKIFTVEIRSLNSKGMDLNLKIPFQFREKEIDARTLVNSCLERGKIDVYISLQSLGETAFDVNNEVVKKYHEQMKSIYRDLGYQMDNYAIASLFRFPEAVSSASHEVDETEWKKLESLITNACSQLKKFREQEGKKLESDILNQLNNILSNLNLIANFETERMQSVKERLLKNLTELQNKDGYDKNRFEQELIYYLEKLDINEEKVRLKAHCEYFLKTMHTEPSPGRKLGFIGQEMGREINTLGSKCNHAEIQKLVVKMKDDLEKIKEQCLNIL